MAQSITGAASTVSNTDSAVGTTLVSISEITVANNAVVAINHGADARKLRNVRILIASTGLDAVVGTLGIASYAKTSSEVTTITFGATAGTTLTFIVIIELNAV